MTLKQALERIEQLERRVRELEARPAQHVHYHTHPAPLTAIGPHYLPQPTIAPPWISPWHVTYGGGQFGSAIGGSS